MIDICITNTLIHEKEYLKNKMVEHFQEFNNMEFNEKIGKDGANVLGRIAAYQDIYYKYHDQD